MTTTLHATTTGAGPTVVFVHGLDSDSTIWEPVTALLGDHSCVALDLPGHGESPVSDDPRCYRRDALLEDLAASLVDLPRPIVFVGHSLGGYLGMAYALTRPDDLGALVLVSTGPGFRDPDAREKWNDRVRENASGYGISEVAATAAFHEDAMVIDRMTELTLPLALVIGADDKAYLGANDYMSRKLPHALRTTVEGARHYVMRSHPQAVADAVRAMSAAARS